MDVEELARENEALRMKIAKLKALMKPSVKENNPPHYDEAASSRRKYKKNVIGADITNTTTHTDKRTKSLKRERVEDYKLIEEENHKLFNKLIPIHLKVGLDELPCEQRQCKGIQEGHIKNLLTQQSSNRKAKEQEVNDEVSTKVNNPKKLYKVHRHNKLSNKEWDEIGQSIMKMKCKLNEMIRREENVKPQHNIRRRFSVFDEQSASRESSLTKYNEIKPIVLDKQLSKPIKYYKGNSYGKAKPWFKRKKSHTGEKNSHKLTIKNLKKYLHTICNSKREMNETIIPISKQSSSNTSKDRKRCDKCHQLLPKRTLLYNKYKR